MAVQNPSASPAMRPGLIDPSRQAEYPITLGKSFSEKEARAVGVEQMLNVRCNWRSKKIAQKQILTKSQRSTDPYRLVVREDAQEPYKYDGAIEPQTEGPRSSHLALVFDKEKSAFVLESISASLNFNLTYAATKSNIDELPRLQTTSGATNKSVQTDDPRDDEDEDEEPDSEDSGAKVGDPYDYRHFLAEARADAAAGNSTPKTSGLGAVSPTLAKSRIVTTALPASPLQSPFTAGSKRRKVDQKSASEELSKGSATGPSNGSKPKAWVGATNSKAKSRPVQSTSTSDKAKGKRQPRATNDKSSHRPGTASPQTYGASPQIIVDEASDLTIDMGSPPPAVKTRHKINLDAFSSHSRAQSRAESTSVSPPGRASPAPRSHDQEWRAGAGKERENSADDDDDDLNDNDIEDLALPSPRATRASNATANRITKYDSPLNGVNHQNGVHADDDDDDDGLAAELEAVFEREDEAANGAVGLGILADQADDESEVSEEE
jgi:hypothetical protein